MAVPQRVNTDQLVKNIEASQIGQRVTLLGPYGRKPVVYCDYTASAKPLSFIEDYLREAVLPYYANTHTTTSFTAAQTTSFREEARLIIRNAVNASEHDSVIFCGSGTTGAVERLIHILDHPKNLVVFAGPFEHHSNLLPWRELGAKMVSIAEDSSGQVDLKYLEDSLKSLSDDKDVVKVGVFSASSNLTGVLTDTVAVTSTLHTYGCLAFWDYATAAPYVKMDMNPVTVSDKQDLGHKDAIFFSPHKFIGGVDSPGILVVKKNLFKNPVPSVCGGGTVFFVTPTTQSYFKEPEFREEGGTPNIVGCIRAGLAVQLKEAVGTDYIMRREEDITEWDKVTHLHLVGPKTAPQLPVFSFLIGHFHTGRYLHHNFICALLNDLFGIQSRGGCSCAGPYAQRLLGINEELAKHYHKLVAEDSHLDRVHLRRYTEYSEREILRPGVTRLGFPYFMSDDVISFVVEAVAMVAEHGWKLLPQYTINPETGQFLHHHYRTQKERHWLNNISYETGQMSYPTLSHPPVSNFDTILKTAMDIFSTAYTTPPASHGQHELLLGDSDEMRWFLLPTEAQKCLQGTLQQPPADFKLPFTVKQFKTNSSQSQLLNTENTVDHVVAATVKVPRPLSFHKPPRRVLKQTITAIEEYKMIQDGDKVLVCLSGGKDSLSLLHTLHQYQYNAASKGVNFQLAAVTIDPQSVSYDPSPLIPYLAALKIPYFFEKQAILEQATNLPQCDSICSFCSRMKRGRLYSCARREHYNVLAMGQHLDDLAESFLMSIFHNGALRTMKANYTVKEGDLRVIRPFVYVREKDLRQFATEAQLPVIPENCPACFEAPKERHRVKQLLAAQEVLFPRLFTSLQAALRPLMAFGTHNTTIHLLLNNDTSNDE
ncbi:uncharacterized protein [Dysidea avara]|uniref:uncharacterized protein isoform X2 n=1 Tax=Dysidea avara TaxID=196820 RepID=UPI0033230B75